MHKKTIRIAIAAAFLICTSAAIVNTPAIAQGSVIGNLLGGASDSALNKLSQPGAFFADKGVRIGLPGPLKKASKLLRFTSKSDLAKDLTKSMNDVAGLAAKEAKPIFREAIDGLTLKDGLDITKQNDGATQYLRDSSESSLSDKVRPLVSKAMGDTGTYDQLEALTSHKLTSKLGFSNENMTDHVTKKTMDGIFKYMAAEEGKARKNPLKTLGGVLGIGD